MFCGSPIAWSSKSQLSVAKSSVEAEYVALSEAAAELLYMKFLLVETWGGGNGTRIDLKILSDSKGALDLTEHPVHHGRTKHINVKYHFVRERVETGEIKIQHVPTEIQTADIFTKPLPGPRHRLLRQKLLSELPAEDGDDAGIEAKEG